MSFYEFSIQVFFSFKQFQTIPLIRADSATKSFPSLVRGKNIRYEPHYILKSTTVHKKFHYHNYELA